MDVVVLCRRAQLRHCLEQLKKQVPLSSDSMRNTTLNLLRQAQLHIKVNTTPQHWSLGWQQRVWKMSGGGGLVIVLFSAVIIVSLLCITFGLLLTCFPSLPSYFRSCRSRMSVQSSWRAVCSGSRGSCGFGWSSCRGARREWGTTVRGRACPPRGQIQTEVGRWGVRHKECLTTTQQRTLQTWMTAVQSVLLSTITSRHFYFFLWHPNYSFDKW